MTKWEEKKITVFGLGKSGLAIVKKLYPLGSYLFVTDSKKEESIDKTVLEEFKNIAIGDLNSRLQLEVGGHTQKCIDQSDLIVLSPGVRTDIPVLQKAKELNIPIVSEIELAYRFLTKPIIAVTGTNGKTTTAILIGELLKAEGKSVVVAGNVGLPLVSIDDRNLDFVVVEISSYQLETIVSFRPWISIILNLTEDHIERHGSMEAYGTFKARIFMNQKKTDYVVYNSQDKGVCKLVQASEARLVPFIIKEMELFLGMNIADIKLRGDHNLENIAAAVTAAKIAGVSKDTIPKVLKSFSGVSHRIEFVIRKNGVDFYNDSKATNPDSTIVAIKTLDTGKKSIILLLGGRDKGTDLTAMINLIKKSVKKVILLGEATERFEKALKQSDFENIEIASDFKSAVITSFNLSKPGDIVLLSPACASFDMFSNFEERGDVFKSLVKNL